MTDNVVMVESIDIEAAAETVYDFLADTDNDPKWRTEVDRMDAKGEVKVGAIVVEYSTFYRFLHSVTPTEAKELTRPHRIVFETPASHPTWLRSTRTIQPLGGNRCLLTYELAFSLDSMKQLLPIALPARWVDAWYRPRIRRYLKNLRKLTEAR
jgi:uncharacterized protein YndB with AHSA1/START domain